MALTAQLAAAGMFFSNMTVFRNDGLPENPLTEFKLPNLPGKVGFAAVGGVGSGTVKPLQDLRVFKVRVASLSCKASVVARLSSGEERAAYIDGCSGSKDPEINRYEIAFKTCRPSDRIEEVRMRGEAGGPFFLYELSFE